MPTPVVSLHEDASAALRASSTEPQPTTRRRTFRQRPSPRDIEALNKAVSSTSTTTLNPEKYQERQEELHEHTAPIAREHMKIQPLPVKGYDAIAIEEYYDRRPLQVGWRLNSLGFPLLGWYMGLLMDKALGISNQQAVQRKRGQELRHHLVHSGSVALIKSGQALSLRPDLIKNKIWADELGKLVDAVGSFPDMDAMKIIRRELRDLAPRLKVTRSEWKKNRRSSAKGMNRLQSYVANDDVLSLFEFFNDGQAVASASIGQVYKARIRRGPQLEAAIGHAAAAQWGGKIVAIKCQRVRVHKRHALCESFLSYWAYIMCSFATIARRRSCGIIGHVLVATNCHVVEQDQGWGFGTNC